MAQVADTALAWDRLEAALSPGGVECPKCREAICQRILSIGRPPYAYRCALCDTEHRPASRAPAGDAMYLVPWPVWLDQMARAVAFGPKSGARPSGAEGSRLRRTEAAREACDIWVGKCPNLVEALFGLDALPDPIRGIGLADERSSVVKLPQPAD